MTRPLIPPALTWHFPTPAWEQEDPRLSVLAFELPQQQLVSFQLILPASLAWEPPELDGVGTVCLHACDEATQNFPGTTFQETLELHGATLHGSQTQNWLRLGGDCPASELPAVLELLDEVLANPAFEDSDVAHQVEAQQAAAKTRLSAPDPLARRAWNQAWFGSQQRAGRPLAGTLSTLANIDSKAVRRWHTAAWQASKAQLVLAGALNDQPKLSDSALLPNWVFQAGSREPLPPVATGAPSEPITIADLPQASQATVIAGSYLEGRQSADWAALRVAGVALCGSFGSRLNLELRERLGYTYGIGGGISPSGTEGRFWLQGSLRADSIGESITRIKEELQLETAFSSEETELAKRYLLGAGPLSTETSAEVAHTAAELAAVGLSSSYVTSYHEQLREVTPEAVSDAFRGHVAAPGVSLAIAGPAEIIEPQLTNAGFETQVVNFA